MLTLQTLHFLADMHQLCEEHLNSLRKNPFKWYNPFYRAHIKGLQEYLSETGGQRDTLPEKYLYGISHTRQQKQA